MQSFDDSMSSFSSEEIIKLQLDNDHDVDKHILNIFSHKFSSCSVRTFKVLPATPHICHQYTSEFCKILSETGAYPNWWQERV